MAFKALNDYQIAIDEKWGSGVFKVSNICSIEMADHSEIDLTCLSCGQIFRVAACSYVNNPQNFPKLHVCKIRLQKTLDNIWGKRWHVLNAGRRKNGNAFRVQANIRCLVCKVSFTIKGSKKLDTLENPDSGYDFNSIYSIHACKSLVQSRLDAVWGTNVWRVTRFKKRHYYKEGKPQQLENFVVVQCVDCEKVFHVRIHHIMFSLQSSPKDHVCTQKLNEINAHILSELQHDYF